MRLPFPVCKNLWAQNLKGSPSAHIIMGYEELRLGGGETVL